MNAWTGQVRELRRAIVVVVQRHRDHRAGPGGAAAQRLARRVEHLGLAADGPLLPHHADDGRIALGKGGGRLAYGARIDALVHRAARRSRRRSPRGCGCLYRVPGRRPDGRRAGPGRSTGRSTGCRSSPRSAAPTSSCGAGYSGNGVGPSVLGGRILASLALGLDDEWSRCGLVRSPPRGLPPEPARFIGGHRRARRRRAQGARRGRRPAGRRRSTARWPRLAPAGLVPLD